MLRAAWLGHWTAPWGLKRGRRWGDGAWALAAISQAWMMGGAEGRWPRLEQKAKWPGGPQVSSFPNKVQPRPDPAWIALLRHGSPRADAQVRGAKESELISWCWEALLGGDGTPWMAAGSVLLDLNTRRNWVAPLGAVESDGRLILPPFLADLIPEDLRALPAGWWEVLLRTMDPEGRLLPEGSLDPALPWSIVAPHTGPLGFSELPADLMPFRHQPWMAQTTGGRWMLSPSVRAWGRGPGASPAGLSSLQESSLALGGDPDDRTGQLLQMGVPDLLPPGWSSILKVDLAETFDRPPCPPACGDPTWDRLRVRWGGELPDSAPGYPLWGTVAHTCGDPFHWMAQGLVFDQVCDLESSLRAFTWAHAHFVRLRSYAWAQRAAYNAALMALKWGDLPAHASWSNLRGPLPSPWRELEAAQLTEFMEGPEKALPLAEAIVASHPGMPASWGCLAEVAVELGDWERVAAILPHISDHPYTRFLEAALGPLDQPPPEKADAETRLSWEAHRLFRKRGDPIGFWSAWTDCPNQLFRLETALQVLERCPAEREVGHLLALEAIAERARSPRHRQRLSALWPPFESAEPAPVELLQTWLNARAHPTWIAWQDGSGLCRHGHGDAPPEGMLSRVTQGGRVPPFHQGRWVWQSHPLTWEGAEVGAALLASPPEALPALAVEPLLLAPWVARLRGGRTPEPEVPSDLLLTDGSEPMASLLQELNRIAPTNLTVLIQGPTGSGKELAAMALHRRSGRSGNLVAVNCSAFAEGLMESELFGHVKGAFTGAQQDRRGAIEMARDGTLFLDEVADLSPRLQSMLLRVIQEREIRRVGSDHVIRVDVRFVAATHRPLDELADKGAFRRDLLFRLNGSMLNLPPLSARRHEFPFLVPRLVARAAESVKQPVPALAPGLAEALARHAWPGNVRELLHALERAILRCEDGLLKPRHVVELETPVFQPGNWEPATRTFQRGLLLETLRACSFRVAEAAEILGLARPALYATAKRLGVDLRVERQNLTR